MYFLGIHILGWLLISLFSVALLFRGGPLKEPKRVSLKEHLLKSAPLFVIPIASTVFMASSYFSGRDLPFESPPRVYCEIQKHIKNENIKLEPDLAEAMALCAMGNIYRCRCEIETLAKGLGETDPLNGILRLLERERLLQEKTNNFLKCE